MPLFKIKIPGPNGELREYPVVFDMGAWYALEELYGLGHKEAIVHAIELLKPVEKGGKGDRFRFTTDMAFVMTQTLDEPLTLKEAQRMRLQDVSANCAALVGAMNEAMPGERLSGKGNAQPPAPGARAASGSGARRSSAQRSAGSGRGRSGEPPSSS